MKLKEWLRNLRLAKRRRFIIWNLQRLVIAIVEHRTHYAHDVAEYSFGDVQLRRHRPTRYTKGWTHVYFKGIEVAYYYEDDLRELHKGNEWIDALVDELDAVVADKREDERSRFAPLSEVSK